MDNDIVGMARKLTSGIPVNPESLSLSEIEAAGPGGRYRSEKEELWDEDDDYHPKDLQENFSPDVISRASYDLWKGNGSKTLVERANERVRDIIENYEAEPLPKNTVKQIRSIVENAVGKIPGVNK